MRTFWLIASCLDADLLVPPKDAAFDMPAHVPRRKGSPSVGGKTRRMVRPRSKSSNPPSRSPPRLPYRRPILAFDRRATRILHSLLPRLRGQALGARSTRRLVRLVRRPSTASPLRPRPPPATSASNTTPLTVTHGSRTCGSNTPQARPRTIPRPFPTRACSTARTEMAGTDIRSRASSRSRSW